MRSFSEFLKQKQTLKSVDGQSIHVKSLKFLIEIIDGCPVNTGKGDRECRLHYNTKF
jgi:hypothetical protein